MKDSTGEAETDATIIRWVGDIESDGSRLRNLSGRSAVLGDGPSRHNEAHGRFLREQAHSLSSITLDDLLGDRYGAEDAHTWALDVTPESVVPAILVESAEEVRPRTAVVAPLGTSSSQLAAVGGAAGSSSALTALLLPDYSSGRQRQSDLAEAEKELQLAAPAVRFCLKLHTPPLPDGSGDFFYVAPPKVLKDVALRRWAPSGAT